jgi:DNA-directed RNA polymerase subunit RPC12/RpoP
MAYYDFKCIKCDKVWEIKLSHKEHEEQKDSIFCECGEKAYQTVTRLSFRLAGEGWFGKASDAIEHPYAITQTELNKNLDVEKRIEDIANNYTDPDPIN